MPLKGYKQSDEHTAKIKAKMQGLKNAYKGRRLSAETRERMRVSYYKRYLESKGFKILV